MDSYKKTKYMAFLREKYSLLEDAVAAINGCSVERSVSWWELLDYYDSLPPEKVRLSDLKQCDSEFELRMRAGIGREGIAAVVEGLKMRYGFGRISQDPHLIIDRAFKRKRIESHEELRALLDYLAESESNSDPRLSILQGLANEAESRLESRL